MGHFYSGGGQGWGGGVGSLPAVAPEVAAAAMTDPHSRPLRPRGLASVADEDECVRNFTPYICMNRPPDGSGPPPTISRSPKSLGGIDSWNHLGQPPPPAPPRRDLW